MKIRIPSIQGAGMAVVVYYSMLFRH